MTLATDRADAGPRRDALAHLVPMPNRVAAGGVECLRPQPDPGIDPTETQHRFPWNAAGAQADPSVFDDESIRWEEEL